MIIGSDLFSAMTFDWYQATVAVDPDELFSKLVDDFPAIERRPVNGIAQYDRCEAAFQGAYKLFDVSYGGNQGANPNIRSTGYFARHIGPQIRLHWPAHRVTRVDVACDFSEEGLFDKIHSVMDRIHSEQGIARKDFGFASPENGRTFYLGSPKSPMQIRLYEKGKKALNEGDETADPNWIRLECQYRPRSAEKEKFSQIDAEGIWGASLSARILIKYVLDLDPVPIKQEPPMNRTDEDKVRYLIRQYRRTLGLVDRERLYQILTEELSGIHATKLPNVSGTDHVLH